MRLEDIKRGKLGTESYRFMGYLVPTVLFCVGTLLFMFAVFSPSTPTGNAVLDNFKVGGAELPNGSVWGGLLFIASLVLMTILMAGRCKYANAVKRK
jgi:hypothetical protein